LKTQKSFFSADKLPVLSDTLTLKHNESVLAQTELRFMKMKSRESGKFNFLVLVQ